MRPFIAIVFFLAGCASTPEADIPSAQTSWHGATYEDAVRSWGTPVRSTTLPNGQDAHTWVSESVASRGSLWPSFGIFGGSHGGVGFGTGVTMGPGYGELQRCERTLFFENGRVVQQTWQGPGDYCGSFRRG
jgi:hypothetical protein